MKYLALLAGILYLFACSDKKTDDCDPDEYEYTIKQQGRVDTLTTGWYFTFQINPGTANVFLYTHTHDGCSIPDGGYTESLVFEVPDNASSFSYTNDELKNANTYYKVSCYCSDVDARAVIQGTIKGQKLSATTWRVEAEVTIPDNSKVISFNKSFTVQ